jgi:[ribosomal protein S18]-alanine N-acetyltransferase
MSESPANRDSGAPVQSAVRIRRMLPADVARVRALDVLSFSLPWPESSYRFEVSENSNAIPLVAESAAGEVIAMSVTWVIIDEAHVATIAVHPGYRRQGLGKRLLAHSLLEAWERGAQLSYLEVRRGNLAAQAMYADFGFAVVGERPRYYQDNHEDALLMTLDRIDPEKLRERMRTRGDPEQS